MPRRTRLPPVASRCWPRDPPVPRPHLPCPLGSDGPRPPRCSLPARLTHSVCHACHCLGFGSHHPPTPQAFFSCLRSSHPTPTLWFAKVVSAFLLGPKIPYFFLELPPPTPYSLSLKNKIFAQSSLHAPGLPKAHVWAMQPAALKPAQLCT